MTDKSLTLDVAEFETNDGARLKQVVHDAEAICVRKFLDELGIGQQDGSARSAAVVRATR